MFLLLLQSVMLYKILLFLFLCCTLHTYAQPDTLQVALPDSLATAAPVQDSIVSPRVATLSWQQDTAYTRLYSNLFPSGQKQYVFMIDSVRKPADKHLLFYMLAGLLLLVGIIRTFFPKHINNLFRLFFQSSYRQKQAKENLLQDNLPSLLLNIAFFLSGGLLIALLAPHSLQLQRFPLWLLWLYSAAILTIIYIGKYVFILFCGWAFNVAKLAANYSFIVFLINKVAGIFLLPLLLLLAFSRGGMYDVVATIALSVVVLMLVYRYVVALSTVVKNLKISVVHFFIYLCAVEILPLLVIYKLLFITIR